MAVAYQPESGPPESEVVTDGLVIKTLEGDLTALDALVRASILYLNRKLWDQWGSVIKRWPECDVEAFIFNCISKTLGDGLEKLRSLEPKTARNYLGYLWKTAHHAIIDYKRGPETRDLMTSSLDANSVPGDDSSPTLHEFNGDEHAKSPFELILLGEMGEQLNQAMAMVLSMEETVILRMWSVGHSIGEIAQVVHRSDNAISIAKLRALQKLRLYFESQLGENPPLQ